MSNSTMKSGNWTLPSTLEEYEQQVRKQSADSLTSETPKTGQPEATKTYEISFVPVPQKQSQPVPPVTTQPVNASVDNQIEEFNKKAEREGMLAPKPPGGLQVILHQTKPKYPQKSVPVDQQVQPAVQPQPKVPPVNTARLSTEEFWRLVDTTSQHLGQVVQITNYPHTRKPQSPEIPVKK